ncbi:hypothetical protein BJF78_13925 [Pseudonocardia sp. CNS-139]|nr:hypothetical protein BJF78_13925 [Pseudonocardia sp. CNS-139]
MGRVMLRGRRSELTAARGLAAAARSGSGASLLVTGPPGAGRSTLLAEAAAAAGGTAVLTAREVESDVPYSGLTELLAPVITRSTTCPRHRPGRCAA